MENKKAKKANNKLVAQSKRLIEGRYNFTLWEMRVYLKMVEMIRKDDTDFKSYRMYFKDLINEYGSKSKNEYKIINLSAKRLLKKLVKLNYFDDNGNTRIVETHLLSSVDYPEDWRKDDENSFIELSFDPHLKPYLLELKGNYLLYDRRNILKLKSKFSVRIYQLLKSQEREKENKAVIEYTVDDLRNMLLVDDSGNPTNEYSKYYMFKKRVIEQAQKEIKKHTDISFTFEEIKKGRKIHKIRFYVYKNRSKKEETKADLFTKSLPKPKKKPQPVKAPDFADPIHQNPAYQMLIDKKISQDQAYKLVTDFDTDFILETIKRCNQENETMKKKNLAGFIVDSIKKKRYEQTIQDEQNKVNKKKQQAQEKANKENMHQMIKPYYDQFEKQKKAKIEEIKNGLDEEEKQELMKATKEKYRFSRNKNDEDLVASVFFGFIIAERYQDTPQFPKIEHNFYYWMQEVHKVNVMKNRDTDMFEIIE